MAGSFGRRGLDSASAGMSGGTTPVFGAARGPASAQPASAQPATPQPASVVGDDGQSPQMRAFLAAERAARGADHEPGVSDVALSTSRKLAAVGGGRQVSMLLAYVLWYFGAAIAAHRFYIGATQSALIMLGLFFGGLALMLVWPPLGLVSLAAWGLWVLADVALIPGLVRRARSGPDFESAFA